MRELRLIGWYLLTIGAIIFFWHSKSFKSGPCTPNLDLLSLMIFGPVALFLLLRSIYKVYKRQGSKTSLLINFIAFSGWLSALFYGV